MVRFFDSSFVLAQLLGQAPDPRERKLWLTSSRRVASSLLRIECVVGLRRAARAQGSPADEEWVRARTALLDQMFASLNFMEIDRSIEAAVRETPALAECRTLDAIHLAAALRFRGGGEDALEIVTIDKRMASVARKLGLAVHPVNAGRVV